MHTVGPFWIIRLGIYLQTSSILRQKRIGLGRNTIFFFQPRFNFVFWGWCDGPRVKHSPQSQFHKTIPQQPQVQRFKFLLELHCMPLAINGLRHWHPTMGIFPIRLLRLRAFSNPPSAYALRTVVTVSRIYIQSCKWLRSVQFGPPSPQSDLSKNPGSRQFPSWAVQTLLIFQGANVLRMWAWKIFLVHFSCLECFLAQVTRFVPALSFIFDRPLGLVNVVDFRSSSVVWFKRHEPACHLIAGFYLFLSHLLATIDHTIAFNRISYRYVG